MKILLVGHGRSGKDEGGQYLEKITGLKFAGTTSIYLTKYVARKMGVSQEEAYRTRHENREIWKRLGDEVRANDPARLIKEAFEVGPISGGVRGLPEIIAAKEITDLIIWIANDRVPHDPTMDFDESYADIIIPNHYSLEEYYERLIRLAKALGIYSELHAANASLFAGWTS